MKKAILFPLMLCYSIAAFSQHSYKQTLNNVATIVFPDTPKMQHDKSGKFYSVVVDGDVYLTQVTVARKSLKELFTSHFNDSLFSGVISGSLTASKGKLLYKKNIEVNGLDGIEFCYRAKIRSVEYYRFHQAFYFNNTLILDGFWTPDSLRSDDKNLRSFFNSFKLAIKQDEVRQDNTTDLAFLTGKIIGYLFIFGFIVLLGFGVVYIIKKIMNK